MYFEKLEQAEKRYVELERMLADPAVIAQSQVYTTYLKEHGRLGGNVATYRRYKKLLAETKEAEDALAQNGADKDLLQMYQEELPALRQAKEQAYQEVLDIVLTEDADSDRNCVVEIRAGTGGDEAAIFVGDLYRMYSKFAEKMGWKVEPLSLSPSDMGGFKEAVFLLSGPHAYKIMQFESGGHRVQRVPDTETQGRIHTSACTVAVMPEAEEVDVQINPAELRIDTYCASGAGGQHVNRTQSAIRITHMPTNIVVTCQDERSQHQNRAKAMRMLLSKLYDHTREEQKQKEDTLRRTMVGSGDRSSKIKTYNFAQNRLTDHRTKESFFNLAEIIDGDLKAVTDHLQDYYKQEKLKQLSA